MEEKDLESLKIKEEREKLLVGLEGENFFRWLKGHSVPNVELLYSEAKSSFLNECYLGATLLFCIAIEQFLLWKIQGINVLAIIDWPTRMDILNPAESSDFINGSLKADIIQLMEGCRDQIMHTKQSMQLMFVGLAKDRNKSYFGKPHHKAVHTGPLACAERALTIFFRVIDYNRKKETS